MGQYLMPQFYDGLPLYFGHQLTMSCSSIIGLEVLLQNAHFLPKRFTVMLVSCASHEKHFQKYLLPQMHGF